MVKNKTVFQNLASVLMGTYEKQPEKRISTYNISPSDDIILRTNNKDEYEKQLLQARQQKLLAYQWKKASNDTARETAIGVTNVRLMYRDADLMDAWPEIGAALDIYAEESCCVSSKGKLLNIYSQSERIKSILEDLFVNRLDIHITLPMVARAMCKYGNNFMLLNIDDKNGVLGWKQLPVYEIERIENGMQNPYGYINRTPSSEETNFVWVGQNESLPYKSWQVAHFRLLTDSIFLPYGCSALHKARRHWRMLSMMEDMMLIYRLERSVERRVFKIYVGSIDDKDVQAYVNDVANNMKRTPIIDPTTGQLDLRKNFMDMTADYFIPVRSENASNPIDTLSAAQNLTAMDDIEYMQNKVLAGLKVPKSFLNFQEAQGKGQNLSLLDIRFTRTINRVQQALLMELNKIAIIHLYMLGFVDDLTNFTITMNNPSSQNEIMEIDNLQKKISTAQSALNVGSNGIQLLSMRRVLKEILKMDDKEISDNFEEIRLEKALAAELEKTSQIIKRTGIFDPIDRIYGEPGAEYGQGSGDSEGNGDSGMGGGGDLGGGFGDSLGDLGEPGEDDMEDIEGMEGETDLENASDVDAGNDAGGESNPQSGGQENPMESILNSIGKELITEKKELSKKVELKEKKYRQNYINRIMESNNTIMKSYLNRINNVPEIGHEKPSLTDRSFMINEGINEVINELNERINNNK